MATAKPRSTSTQKPVKRQTKTPAKVPAKNQTRPVFVVDGARTPFLKARTGPGPFRPSDLAVNCGRTLLARQPFEPTEFDEVILGCIMPGPEEANIGRVVSLRLKCGDHVPAWTVQRNCATGMQAIDCAAQAIQSGRANLILAGGTEAMSHAPIIWGPEMTRWLGQWMSARTIGQRVGLLGKLRPGFLKPVIALLLGLTDPVVGVLVMPYPLIKLRLPDIC